MASETSALFNKVSVIGLGYVGLPTAAIIASRGINVTGVDVNSQTVETINKGEIHIVEPDLDILVRSAVTSGNLRATTTPEPADAFIIAVPTPFKEGNKPDLTFLQHASDALAPVLKKGDLVILESTSPVGTTQQISTWLSAARPDLSFPSPDNTDPDICVAHSPERVLPGRVLIELVNNDRVIGGLSNICSKRAKDLYSLFVNGTCHLTNARTAELVKLAENAYRDTNIAFANEMSLVCDKLDVDVWNMIDLANLHPRVEILKPGPGVGGHCIAVDPWFIVDSAPAQTPLIQATRKVNDGKPNWVIDQALNAAQKGSAIACLGLAYKADIDDLRESPAMDIVGSLAARHDGPILVAEPNISELPTTLAARENITLTTFENAVQQASTVVVLTDHREFKEVDPSLLEGKKIIDTRGIWRESQK